MTNTRKVINRYVRNKIERECLEAYLMQTGYPSMIVEIYLQQADRRKEKRQNVRGLEKTTHTVVGLADREEPHPI